MVQKARCNIRGINPYIAIVCDDVASTPNIRFMDVLCAMAMEGRHYNMCQMFTTQHITKSLTTIRSNNRYLAIFTTTHMPTIEYLYKVSSSAGECSDGAY